MNPTDDRSVPASTLRRQAEALALAQSSLSPADLAALPPEETWRMLHELRVHQIELELQNEDLRVTRQPLETAKAHYFDLYEMAPVGYCTLNAEGIILEANLAVSTLLGIARGGLINQPLSRFLFSDDQDILHLLRKILFVNGEPQGCDLRMVLPGGTIFWVRLDAILMTDAAETPQCRMVISDINQRKLSEEALRTSEQRLRFLVQSTSDSQVILNPDGTLRYLSPAMEKITGFSLAALEGRAFATLIHPDDTHRVRAVWEETLAHPEQTVTLQFRHVHKTRGWVFLEAIAQSFLNEPLINGVIASVRDISERYALERTVHQHERDLEAIFNATTESIHLIDTQGTVLMANEYTARRLGTTVEDLVGRPIFDFFPPEVAARRKEYIRQVVASGQPLTMHDQRDGQSFESRLWPISDASSGIQRIAIFCKEVSERIAAEQALARSQTLLNATQQLTRVGGWEWDVEQQSLTWTDETYRIHGLVPADQPADGAEHIRQSLACYPPEDRALVAAAFQRCVASGEPYDLRVRFVAVDGRKLWVRTVAEPVWADGRVTLVRGNIMDITRQVEQEQYLHIFRNIVASTTDAMAYLDQDYRYVVVNDAYEVFSGRDREHLIGLTVAEYLGEEVFKEVVKPEFDRCLQGEVINYRRWFDYQTLGRRYVDVSYFPCRDDNNRIIGIIAQTRDITDHIEAAEALRASDERFRQIFDRSPAGTAIVGPDLRFQMANKSLCRFLGYSEDELLGRTFADITHPEDRERGLTLVHQLLTGEIDQLEAEKRYLHKNGESLWARVNVTLVRDANQQPLFFLPIILDIRERKKAEQILRQSEGRFRQLLESLPAVAIQGYDPYGTVLYWNQASERLYGFTAQEALGRNLLDLIIPPEIRNEVHQAMRDMAESRRPIPRAELSLLCRDGSRVTVDSSHLLLDGPDGSPEIYSVDIDLTVRKQMEDALQERQAYLQSIFRASPIGIGVVIDRMFSDVNSQLCTITGYNEGELLGQNARMLYPTEAEYRWVGEEKYRQISRFGTGTVETRWQCKDGRIIDVLLSSTPITIADLSQGVTFSALDITERKQAEIRLQEQATFTRRILDSTSAHIAILDSQGMIIDVNTPWCRFAQENQGAQTEKLGPGTSYFCSWDAQHGDITGAEKAFAGIRQVQSGERNSFEIEYPCHSPEENRWFSLRVLPLAGGKGQVLVSHTDVSVLKQSEEHLLAALEEKEVLLREVHHRVKNNLAAIISLLDMQRRMLNDPQGRDILDRTGWPNPQHEFDPRKALPRRQPGPDRFPAVPQDADLPSAHLLRIAPHPVPYRSPRRGAAAGPCRALRHDRQ